MHKYWLSLVQQTWTSHSSVEPHDQSWWRLNGRSRQTGCVDVDSTWVDEKMKRRLQWRSVWSRCPQPQRLLVNRSISAKVNICIPSLRLYSSFKLSVFFVFFFFSSFFFSSFCLLLWLELFSWGQEMTAPCRWTVAAGSRPGCASRVRRLAAATTIDCCWTSASIRYTHMYTHIHKYVHIIGQCGCQRSSSPVSCRGLTTEERFCSDHISWHIFRNGM